MDENLIGYLLDALEVDDRREVEGYLRGHPEAQARLELLRRTLAPLAVDAEQPEPPPLLATTTLARIAEHRCQGLPQAPPVRSLGAVPRRWLRRADLAVAAILLVVVGGLAATWLLPRWHDSQRLSCQNTLQSYWQALQVYSGQNEGHFPKVVADGPTSLATMFVPTLAEAGCLPPQKRPACSTGPESSQKQPTLQDLKELWSQRSRTEFPQQARAMAGNYAYSLGYLENGTLHGLSQEEDQNRPLLADHRPRLSSEAENSPNHGGLGQNVLYVGGHARWHTSPIICGDNIYLNQNHKILAGVGHNDTVLGCGEASPTDPDD